MGGTGLGGEGLGWLCHFWWWYTSALVRIDGLGGLLSVEPLGFLLRRGCRSLGAARIAVRFRFGARRVAVGGGLSPMHFGFAALPKEAGV